MLHNIAQNQLHLDIFILKEVVDFMHCYMLNDIAILRK